MIIEPDEGMTKEIGRQLLELADNPHDVQWATWPVTGFKVPVELAAKLKAARQDSGQEQPTDQAEAPRRRGRPRKAEATVRDTDDTEKEE